jgi:putative endonuclease
MKLAGGVQVYYVYMLTNKTRSVLYIGITNNLKRRVFEHAEDSITARKHFTGKYNVIYLVYWEKFKYVNKALFREKELKGWSRKKRKTW